MKSSGGKIHFMHQSYKDESLKREWENIYNSSALGSETETDLLGSKMMSSENDFSRFLKNARFSFDLQESVQIGGKKHTPDLSIYRDKLYELFQINYSYHQKTNEIRNNLTQAVNLIHEKFGRKIRDFQLFSGYVEDNPLEQLFNMSIFVRKSLQDYAEQTLDLSEYKEKIGTLRKENILLTTRNNALVDYIEERKRYSENLKIKIGKLKDEVKQIAMKDNQYRQILQKLDQFEYDGELKYRNRTDLIMIVRSLAARIIKHTKQCKNSEREGFLSLELKEKISGRVSPTGRREFSPNVERSPQRERR